MLALFPIVDLLVPEVAFRIEQLAPDGLPGGVLLGRPWFWVVLAMVVVAVGYARLRDLPIRVSLPGRGDLDTVAVAMGGTLLVAGVLLLALHAVGSSVAAAASVAGFPNPSPGFLFLNAVVPGVLVGLGYGFLFYGAILEGLTSTLRSRSAFVAIVALAGLYHWLVDPVWQLPLTNFHLLFALVFVVGTSLAIVELSRMDPGARLRDVLTPVRVGAIVLAAGLSFVVAVDVLSGATSAGELLLAGGWFVVFGLGAWVRVRSGSVVLPALAIAVFQVVLLAAPSLELTWGLVTTGA